MDLTWRLMASSLLAYQKVKPVRVLTKTDSRPKSPDSRRKPTINCKKNRNNPAGNGYLNATNKNFHKLYLYP